jgi:hypothetical protein
MPYVAGPGVATRGAGGKTTLFAAANEADVLKKAPQATFFQ